MSVKDFAKLYPLQNRFLKFWETLNLPFYLTGGTALGRFYLNHRFSEDLDFFVNANSSFKRLVTLFETEIKTLFEIDVTQTVIFDDFARFFISDNNTFLKIEFVNDVAYRCGEPLKIEFGKIDTPANILANKITAILDREEPKDMFDIVHIALEYKFNWGQMFFEAKKKAFINEIDVEQRINTFPVEWFENVYWTYSKINLDFYKNCIKQIANDFITSNDNSICTTNINLINARPTAWKPEM